VRCGTAAACVAMREHQPGEGTGLLLEANRVISMVRRRESHLEGFLVPVLLVARPRAMGSPAFLRRYICSRGRRRSVPMTPQTYALGNQEVSGTFLQNARSARLNGNLVRQDRAPS
jgi:hypothetical protein